MPFQYNNVCYPDMTSVVDVLTGTYSASYTNLVFTPNLTTGAIGLTMKAKSNGANSNTTIYVSTTCNDFSSRATFDKVPLNDIVVAGIFVFLLAVGFLSGLGLRR